VAALALLQRDKSIFTPRKCLIRFDRSCPRLTGLTERESWEFALLDAAAPVDDAGLIAWEFEGDPLNARERRWLELYEKHVAATKSALRPNQNKGAD